MLIQTQNLCCSSEKKKEEEVGHDYNKKISKINAVPQHKVIGVSFIIGIRQY